ncbi:ferrochelatase [Spongorhabdus nitratireducens]
MPAPEAMSSSTSSLQRRGVLLVNLGSPDSTSVPDVRRYLNQFLMDRYVIDLPWLLRRFIVSAFVLPKRPQESAEAYASIWTPEGSPLKVNSQKLTDKLQQQTDLPVRLAMRYASPDMETELTALARQPGIEEILLLPLYPHYAMSTVKTVVEEAQRIISKHQLNVQLKVQPVFYDDKDYIEALVESARPWLEQPYDHLLFSYHGLPERHLKKDDPTGSHCLSSQDCCQRSSTAHPTCYRHQIYRTTAEFVERAEIPVDRYSVAFQSRLGRDKWLEPYTEPQLQELAANGVKNLLVICPAFVADCIETLEEIGIRGQEVFQEAGGEKLTLIPCLNDHPMWVNTIQSWIEKP